MRVIKQKVFLEINVEKKNYDRTSSHLQINQSGDCLCIDKQGAKQLIEVLKEFIENA